MLFLSTFSSFGESLILWCLDAIKIGNLVFIVNERNMESLYRWE
jgi:hypothetical protein